MFLIDDIILLPIKPVLWLAEKINEVVERELSDEGRIKEKLMELQMRFELDELSEEEYKRQEQELLERLDSIRKAKETATANSAKESKGRKSFCGLGEDLAVFAVAREG